MAIDRHQLRSLIRRSLERRRLWSLAAENLLMGTAAQESQLGTYLRQLNGGPALGIFQMERPTFDWVHQRSIPKFAELSRVIFPMLEWDLDAAIFLCRLRYRLDQQPLPDADDVPALAAYWKRVWNTAAGKGTVEQFVDNYRRLVIETS